MPQMESDFFLVLLSVTLVCLACSAQKTVHSLCLSVKHANCNNLNKVSTFRLQLSINRIRQQLPYNYSYLIEKFSPISFLVSRRLSSGIINSDLKLENLVYPKLTRRSIFRSDGNNVGSRVTFYGFQVTNILSSNLSLYLDSMKSTLTPSILLKSPQPLGSGNSIYFRHPDSGNSIIIMIIQDYHSKNTLILQNQGSGHSLYYRQSIQTLAKQDTTVRYYPQSFIRKLLQETTTRTTTYYHSGNTLFLHYQGSGCSFHYRQSAEGLHSRQSPQFFTNHGQALGQAPGQAGHL